MTTTLTGAGRLQARLRALEERRRRRCEFLPLVPILPADDERAGRAIDEKRGLLPATRGFFVDEDFLA